MSFNHQLVLAAIGLAVLLVKLLWSPVSIPRERRAEVVRQRWLVAGLFTSPTLWVIFIVVSLWRLVTRNSPRAAKRMPLIPKFSLAELLVMVLSLGLVPFIVLANRDELEPQFGVFIYSAIFFPWAWMIALNRIQARAVPPSFSRALYVGLAPHVLCALILPIISFGVGQFPILFFRSIRLAEWLRIIDPMREFSVGRAFNVPLYSIEQLILGASIVALHSWAGLHMRGVRAEKWVLALTAALALSLFCLHSFDKRDQPWNVRYIFEISNTHWDEKENNFVGRDLEEFQLSAEKSLFLYSEKRALVLCDAETTKELRRFKFEESESPQYWFCSTDWRYMATQFRAKSKEWLRVWEVRTGRHFELPVVRVSEKNEKRFVFSPKRDLLGVNLDDKVQVWDCASGKMLVERATETKVNNMAWSPDGSKLLFWKWEKTPAAPRTEIVEWIDADKLSEPRRVSLELYPVWRTGWNESGSQLLVYDFGTGKNTSRLRFIDSASARVVKEETLPTEVSYIAFLPDERLIIADTKGITIRGAEQSDGVVTIPFESEIPWGKWMNQGDEIIYSHWTWEGMEVWNTKTGRLLEKHPDLIGNLPRVNHAETLFVTHYCMNLWLYDRASKRFILDLSDSSIPEPSSLGTYAYGFSADDRLLFVRSTGNEDKSLLARLACWERKSDDSSRWLWWQTWGSALSTLGVAALAFKHIRLTRATARA